ncbi:hypothetical protein [Streptomyces griseiscabiei]|uniref:Integral membrane protein n=1 Tax=Streptomyces griseiscabiei TaxID=2993540 RepID=A0ABU4LBL4_9ACTN|nr:hypothetical protein [Streptomyces griseiscabiei]MBZ3900122.1 hypothetical protein [Streptomyces griseiscabiei]MDX2913127.1 hypothetical protein [Streptomyces griseiscabiei]
MDVHREMTADMPCAARLRADADLVAHALRVRLGLDSASPAGRFFALAAPFALAAGAVAGGLHLTRWYAGLVLSPAPVRVQLSAMDAASTLSLLLSLLVCVGAVIALTGRWGTGAGVAVCGLLGTAVQGAAGAPAHDDGALTPVVALLTVAVVLACPPDRRGDRRLSAAAGAMAAAGWFPIVVVHAGAYTGAFGVTTDYGAWPMLVLACTGAVLALRARSSGLREMGAMAVACPPLVAHSYATAWGDPRPPVLGTLLLLSVVTGLTALVQAVRHRR